MSEVQNVSTLPLGQKNGDCKMSVSCKECILYSPVKIKYHSFLCVLPGADFRICLVQTFSRKGVVGQALSGGCARGGSLEVALLADAFAIFSASAPRILGAIGWIERARRELLGDMLV